MSTLPLLASNFTSFYRFSGTIVTTASCRSLLSLSLMEKSEKVPKDDNNEVALRRWNSCSIVLDRDGRMDNDAMQSAWFA